MDLIIENVEHLTVSVTDRDQPHALLVGPLAALLRQQPEGEPAAAQAAPEPASNCVSRVGDSWPEQGGIYAGLFRGDGGSQYHLIVATGDGAEANEIAWGGYDQDATGATSAHDGPANTAALVASSRSHPAAQWAKGLTINGHSDWYLPSRRELSLCLANVPDAFTQGWHWSSTQYSRNGAWYATFGDGDQYYYGKSAQLRARAVRRFSA